jgi:glycosyltransferase involved in cell wall biosynthesis
MASGLPVVIAAAGALPEVTAGAVATAVEPGDTAGLAAALIQSLEPSQREAAAARNRTCAAAFDPRTVVATLLDAVRGAMR